MNYISFIHSSIDGHLVCFHYCKWCCSEHWGMSIFLNCVFLWIYAQDWDLLDHIVALFLGFFFLFFSFIFISWRLITLQYCTGFCHTLTWIGHGFTCIPHPDSPSHLPLYPIPLGLPSAPAPSTCLMHPTWAGDLFHPR